MAMHADEVPVDAALVRRLVAAQFPHWASLDVTHVVSAGTDHALYRLGEDLVARMPRMASAADQGDKERRWLPVLAPQLTLAVPVPLALGAPGLGYPFRWSVCPWLPGADAEASGLADPVAAARALGGFVRGLRGLDATGAPAPGAHNAGRGVALVARDAATRAGIAACAGMVDGAAALAQWQVALAAPAWPGPPCWVHGDLHGANLLIRNGALAGVLDFGCLGAGDPACDLAPGWTVFAGAARTAFREAAGMNAAAWARGRGWALSVAVIALPYYRNSNPVLAGIARRAIAAIVAETPGENGR